MRFTRSLATAAAAVSGGIPDPVVLRREAGVSSRGLLRMAPLATLTGAVAVGLLVAAAIGMRSQPPVSQQPEAFVATGAASEELASLGFACESVEAETRCLATAPDHVHRVTLTVDDGRVVQVEARIESTDGTDLDLRGMDDLLSDIAVAVLRPEWRTAAGDWIGDAYPTCGPRCSTDGEEVGMAMSKGSQSVSLSLREP